MTDVMDRPAADAPQFSTVGTRPIRPDGVDKVIRAVLDAAAEMRQERRVPA